MIKLSILEVDGEFAYMEYQNGNDPKVYNDTYGTSGFMDLGDLFESLLKTYEGEEIILTKNIVLANEYKKIPSNAEILAKLNKIKI